MRLSTFGIYHQESIMLPIKSKWAMIISLDFIGEPTLDIEQPHK